MKKTIIFFGNGKVSVMEVGNNSSENTVEVYENCVISSGFRKEHGNTIDVLNMSGVRMGHLPADTPIIFKSDL